MSVLCWLIGFFDVSVVASCLGIVAGIDNAPESVSNKNSDEDLDWRKTFVANEGDSEETDDPVAGSMAPAGIDVESPPATRTAGTRNTEDSEMQENPIVNDERLPVFEQEENSPMAAGQVSEEEECNPLAAEQVHVSQPKGERKKKTKKAGKKNAAQTSVTEEEDNPSAASEPQPSAATSPEPARDGAGPVIPPA